MTKPEDVLAFWLDELTPEDWYRGGDELDQKIKVRFESAWETAAEGGYGMWLTYPSGVLAYLILTDQMSRNMFRGSEKSFQLDRNARAAAKIAIARGWDLKIDEPARQFFYLPLRHSECQCDQDRSVRLVNERMPEGREAQLLHSQVHREIIRMFGRFPYRNEALGRETTPAEAEFLRDGGYGKLMQEFGQKAAA